MSDTNGSEGTTGRSTGSKNASALGAKARAGNAQAHNKTNHERRTAPNVRRGRTSDRRNQIGDRRQARKERRKVPNPTLAKAKSLVRNVRTRVSKMMQPSPKTLAKRARSQRKERPSSQRPVTQNINITYVNNKRIMPSRRTHTPVKNPQKAQAAQAMGRANEKWKDINKKNTPQPKPSAERAAFRQAAKLRTQHAVMRQFNDKSRGMER